MNIPTEEPAVATLRSFFAAMNEWEREMNRHYHSLVPGKIDKEKLPRDQKVQRGQLERIFERFCEVGARATRFEDAGMSTSEPPMYDPELEVVLSAVGRGEKVIVETKQEYSLRSQYKYELVERDGVWLIRDNRKRRPGAGTTWRKDLL